MKIIVIVAALISIGLLSAGLYCDMADLPNKDQFYGFGTISLFLITFPLFLFWRRNKVDLQKYTWRNENLPHVSRDNKKTED